MTIADKPNTAAVHWYVLGAGAMGCLWATAIAKQAADSVSLLLKNRAALTDYPGFIRDHNTASDISLPAYAVEDMSARGTTIKYLLVATKAQHTLAALASVQPMLCAQTRIVLLQNGLRSQREATRLYGKDSVYCLTTSHGAWLRGPFDVVHAGVGEAWLGQLLARPESGDDLHALLAALPDREMNIHADVDIESRLWQKLAVNCAVNALTVIYDCRNGELLTDPQRRQKLRALCAEISALMQTLVGAPAMPELESLVIKVLKVTAQNFSSTLQDVRQGRETEISELNGYLVELAERQQLDCPLNRALLQQVAMVEFRLRRDVPARST